MDREALNSKKEMILEFVNSKSYKPMSTKEMAVVLQVPAKEKKDFSRFRIAQSGGNARKFFFQFLQFACAGVGYNDI